MAAAMAWRIAAGSKPRCSLTPGVLAAAASTSAMAMALCGPLPRKLRTSTPSSAARRAAAGEIRSRPPPGGALTGCGCGGGGGTEGLDGGGGAATGGAAGFAAAARRADPGEHSADRRLGPDGHEDLGQHAFLEDLDLERTLLRFHDRHDVAADDVVAGLLQPFHDRALFHVGAQRRHEEVAQADLPCGLTSASAAAQIVSIWGTAASSRCLG